MKYYLPEFPLDLYERLFVGIQRTRYATATDVKFIDDKFLVAAQLLNRTLFLIDYSDGFKVVDSIKTNLRPDLIDYKDNLIVTSNQTFKEGQNGGVSLFEIKENKINFIKDFSYKNTEGHGCLILDNENILFSSLSELTSGIFSLNIKTEKLDKIYTAEKSIRDMDLYGDYLYITSAPSSPGKHEKRPGNNKITVINLKTKEVIYELTYGYQMDSITIKENLCFLTSQLTNEIICFKINDLKLEIIGKIDGLDFPHGIDVHGDFIAVSNYGDNSIDIINYKEKLNLV